MNSCSPDTHDSNPSSTASRHQTLRTYLIIYSMANLQRVVISLLLILTASFLFLAQTSSAAKGPKITNKVNSKTPTPNRAGQLTATARSFSISRMGTRNWVGW